MSWLPTIDEMVTAVYNTDPAAFMKLKKIPGPNGGAYMKRDGDNWRVVPKFAAMRVFLDAVRRCPELDEPYIRVAFRKRCTKVFDTLMEKHCTIMYHGGSCSSRALRIGYTMPDSFDMYTLMDELVACGLY
jgi:hypothetical protein